MIVVTVGTQLPFDRLIRAMDAIAPSLDQRVFAQTGRGSYVPSNMQWQPLVTPAAFDAMLAETSLIVSHAGTGTFLMAQKLGKPVVLVPRRAAEGEHRNDHQFATVEQLAGRPGVRIAETTDTLEAEIRLALAEPFVGDVVPVARQRLFDGLESFIATALDENEPSRSSPKPPVTKVAP